LNLPTIDMASLILIAVLGLFVRFSGWGRGMWPPSSPF
jgi:hypothetical protein